MFIVMLKDGRFSPRGYDMIALDAGSLYEIADQFGRTFVRAGYAREATAKEIADAEVHIEAPTPEPEQTFPIADDGGEVVVQTVETETKPDPATKPGKGSRKQQRRAQASAAQDQPANSED